MGASLTILDLMSTCQQLASVNEASSQRKVVRGFLEDVAYFFTSKFKYEYADSAKKLYWL
jgi:hypothetical protein